MKQFILCAILLSTLPHANLLAVSMVYNFRIAQITKQPIFEKTEEKPHMAVILPFDQFRKKHDGTRQNFLGSLGSYIYDFGHNYFRIDFAFSHIKEHEPNGSTFSDTEADDILFTVGHNFILNKKADVTISGLVGIPTHRLLRLQHTDFGYSQVGFGVQLDGFYGSQQTSAFLYGARYIRFISRHGRDTTEKDHLFTLGNVGDLFFAYKHNWENQGIEAGYTARARFGARVHPHLDDITEKANYLRSNFYAVYKYKFFINDLPSRLLFDISYGYDHKPKVFGNKYIVTLWASLNINF